MKRQREGRKKHGAGAVLWAVLFSLLSGVAVWFAAMLIWQGRQWSSLKMNEIISQLITSIQGTGNGMVGSFLLWCVLPAVGAAALTGLILWLTRHRSGWRLASVIGTVASLCAILGLVVYAYFRLDVGAVIQGTLVSSDYIEENYADPKSVGLTFPQRKRNLIYIWLESMETSYADVENGGALEQNAIPELTRLAQENVSFTGTQGGVNGAYVTTGATWTAGALFAHTAGLPLKIPIADSAMDNQEYFFPGVTAIGDILAENGYQQALLIGSNASFGGRRNYFSQHGGYTIWDYNYSKETGQIPEDYYVWWGYEDDKLFSFAQEHLTQMAASGQPFNLSLLTVDTHFTDGYLCPDCEDEFPGNQYLNVVACSSRKVAAFIEWIMAQPFYEDTTIVICGDHLTMDVGCSNLIGEGYSRRVYATIINPAAQVEEPDAYRSYTTLDLFPTTLAALGVEIEGDRLGLGANLFSAQPTLLERDGMEKLNQELARKSQFLNSMSGISSQVYTLSEEFSATHVLLTARFLDDSISFTLQGLSEIEDQFTDIELFAEKMYGERRSTLWYSAAQRQPDGSYTIQLPLSALNDVDPFTIHFYAMTEAGRIKVDKSYTCSVADQTLVYEPDGT